MDFLETDLSDKVKRDSFQCCGYVNTTEWMHHMDANKIHGAKAKWELCKNATRYFEQILEVTPHKTTAVRQFTSHLKNK